MIKTIREKPVLGLPYRIITFCTNLSALKEAATAHSNGNNSCSAICMGGDVRRLCKQGRLKEALGILQGMSQQGIRPDSSTFTSLLQECVTRKALPEGKLALAHMRESGCKLDISLGTKLVIMYAKCGSLGEARQVLDEMSTGNAVSYTAMIAAYVKHGDAKEALALFYEMQRRGIRPDLFTFASVLPACASLASLEDGRKVYGDIMRSGLQPDIFVDNALVDMYSKCGSMENARKVFDEMPKRDVVSWSTLIGGYAQNGRFDEALLLFGQMQLTGVRPNSVTFASVLHPASVFHLFLATAVYSPRHKHPRENDQ